MQVIKEREMYIPKDKELAFDNHEQGLMVANALIEEGYVVMLSLEEELLILNYEMSEGGSNRNDVVFMLREDFEDKYEYIYDEEGE